MPFPPRLLLYRLRPVSRSVFRRRWRVRVHGTEHVPRRGPVIFAANHIGVLDGPLLAVFAPRPVHALTKREMFVGRTGRFLLAVGQIPLDRYRVDSRAVRTTLRVLRDGGAVAIFPEGRRGGGDLELFHRGAAYFAMVTGAPVVPVVFLGTRQPGGHTDSVPPRGSVIDVAFGSPFAATPTPWPRTRAAVEEVSVRLRERMLADVRATLERTGRSLPGPLPAEEREPDPGGGVTEPSR